MPKRAAATLSDTCCRSDHDCRNPNLPATGGCRTLANAEAYRHGSSATHSCSNAYVGSATHSCSNAYVGPSTDSHSEAITTGCAHANSEPNSGADAGRYA